MGDRRAAGLTTWSQWRGDASSAGGYVLMTVPTARAGTVPEVIQRDG